MNIEFKRTDTKFSIALSLSFAIVSRDHYFDSIDRPELNDRRSPGGAAGSRAPVKKGVLHVGGLGVGGAKARARQARVASQQRLRTWAAYASEASGVAGPDRPDEAPSSP